MAVFKQKNEETGEWEIVPLGATSGVEVSDTAPTNPMTDVWVDTSGNGGTIADYIIAQGNSDNWYYRKWASGKYECWKKVWITTSIAMSWEGFYFGVFARINYPITFIEIPYEFTDITNGSNMWKTAAFENTVSQSRQYDLISPLSMPNKSVRMDFYVLGRWK